MIIEDYCLVIQVIIKWTNNLKTQKKLGLAVEKYGTELRIN